MNQTFIEKVRDALVGGRIIGDGHTIFAPKFYEPYFSVEELREANLIRDFESDLSDSKRTIFGENGVVEKLEDSVYNLDFLYWLHRKLEIEENVTMFGRGSQAQQIVGQIKKAIGFVTA